MKYLSVIVLSLIILQGCAAANKPLAVNEMKDIHSIQLVQYEHPPLRRHTMGAMAAGVPFAMFGAIGGGIGGSISMGIEVSQGKDLTEECKLPDFGALVFDGFLSSMHNSLQDWPTPTVRQIPITDEFKPVDSGYTISLHVYTVLISDSDGLATSTIGEMINPKGETVWKKGYMYKTSDFSKPHSLKALEAENGKLLKQEMIIAAEKTVSDLIRHLKGTTSAGSLAQ